MWATAPPPAGRRSGPGVAPRWASLCTPEVATARSPIGTGPAGRRRGEPRRCSAGHVGRLGSRLRRGRRSRRRARRRQARWVAGEVSDGRRLRRTGDDDRLPDHHRRRRANCRRVITRLAADDSRTLIVTGIGPAPGSHDPACRSSTGWAPRFPAGSPRPAPGGRHRHPDRSDPDLDRLRRARRAAGRDHRRRAVRGGPTDHDGDGVADHLAAVAALSDAAPGFYLCSAAWAVSWLPRAWSGRSAAPPAGRGCRDRGSRCRRR